MVLTIIIIIILATVSINTLFGSDGLITRAQQAKEMAEAAQVKEQMELAKMEAYLDGNGKITADSYFDQLEEAGIIVDKEKDVVDNGDGTYEVTTEGGEIFEVTITEDGDVEIDYVGKGENIGPRIREIKTTNKTTNSVTVEVDARNAENADYTYTYQKVGESEWKDAGTSKNNTCTIENLESNESYTIKVKVETKNGVAEKETSTTIGELPEGTITFGEVEWIGDGTASVAINTSEEGYQLQYQKNSIEGQWTTIGSGEKITGLVHNDTIYGRLFDGVNGTKDEASVSIKDEVDPVVTVTPGGTTTNSITVSVSAIDNESGMADSLTYTYYIKKTSEEDTSYVAKASNVPQNSYTFTGLTQETSYDVKVEVVGDKAGRKGTGTLPNQVTTKVGGADGDLIEGNIVASSPTWSNGEASIKLTTSTGMQIQYQVNGIDEESWTTATTGVQVTGLHHNDTVYARLFDGTNAGDYGSVSIQDGIDPVVTVSPGGTTTNSIAVSVSAVDNESGMADSVTYTYYIKKSTEADSSYVAKANGIAQNSYTFTGLQQETSYDVKVEVTGDKAGRKGTGTLANQVTTKVGGAEGGLVTGNIVTSTPIWASGTASIKLTTNTGMQIQYQVNGITEGSWTTINTGAQVSRLHHNDTVYARLYDGTNFGDYGSVSIQDGIDPVVTVSPGGTTTNSVTVNVVAVDNESGMADNVTYTYYIKKTSEPESSYVAKANNVAQNSYTFTGLTQETSYDVKVEVVGDKAGRKGTGVLGNQTTGKVGGASSGLVSGNIVASSPTWSSGEASITLTTNTGLQIQYQKNSISGSWTTISSGGKVTGLKHNDTVYARLFDGTNTGDYGSVSIKDTISPSVSISTTSTSSSITVKVTASDSQAGISKIEYSKNGGTNYYTGSSATSTSYTFSGLTYSTSYSIKVRVTDKAGNQTTRSTTKSTLAPLVTTLTSIQSKTVIARDSLGNTVTVPGGFKVVTSEATTADKGIVIQDSSGNQFVWIPVGNYKKTGGTTVTNQLIRRVFISGTGASTYSEGKNKLMDSGAEIFGEEDSRSVGKSTYNEFKTSVNKYKGYYIGRYEQSSSNTSKSGYSVWINITRDKALTQANNMYNGNQFVKSTLTSSYAWDTALNFICQNSTKGYGLSITNSKDDANIGTGTRYSAGSYSADKYCNIYDMLGNVKEWNTEYVTNSSKGTCCAVGANYYSTNKVNTYGIQSTSSSYTNYGFRVQLYIK